MFRPLMVMMLACALLLAGCRVDTSPKTVMEHAAGQQPSLRKAPRRGEFFLYALPAQAEVEAQAAPGAGKAASARELVLRCLLARGEPFGFARGSDGGLEAVPGKGDREALEPDRSYVWVMRAAPGQLDKQRTALLATAIVLGVVVLGAIIIQGMMDDLEEGFESGPGFTGW
jgi:hypothetical protein